MRHTIINNSHCNVYRIRKLFRSIDVQSDDTFLYFTEAAVVNNDKWPQHIVRTWFWRRHQEFLFSTEQRLLCAHYLISKTETMPSRQRLRQRTRRIHEVDTEGGENSCRQRCVSFFCLFLSFFFYRSFLSGVLGSGSQAEAATTARDAVAAAAAAARLWLTYLGNCTLH